MLTPQNYAKAYLTDQFSLCNVHKGGMTHVRVSFKTGQQRSMRTWSKTSETLTIIKYTIIRLLDKDKPNGTKSWQKPSYSYRDFTELSACTN